jgi:hypothetical protein
MFLICLLLIGLIALACLAEKALLAVEQAEFIPVSVRVKEVESRERKHLHR